MEASSADLPETDKLLPLDERVPEISQGFANPADSQSSLPSVYKVGRFDIRTSS